MNNNEIGIGIIDVYSDEDLQNCISSIPQEFKDNIVTVSNKRKPSIVCNRHYSNDVPFATLRNYLLTQLRIKGFKYYFILNSNIKIKNPDIFNNTIKLANTFGTWFITGQGDKNVTLEDDTNNLSLNISPTLNTNFIFLYSGIIKNFGFFDERFFDTKDLDVLDYILKLRRKDVYPPNHYNPTIDSSDVEESSSEIEKINFKDFSTIQKNNGKMEKSLEMTFAYFYHEHKYIPNQNDPVGVTQDELFKFMEKLQAQYGNSQK
jgi:hypothetical protein